jgi:hypothetical protein
MYFLKKKSNAFEIFKKFKVIVEKILEKKIWSLRSDRDGKYLSKKLKSYCENYGIRRLKVI